jgi:glucose/arabinose dehydrogenase/cytochrome c2
MNNMSKQLIRAGTFTAFFLAMSGCTPAEPGAPEQDAFQQDYWIEDYVGDLSFPWSLAWLPDGSLLITERLGRIKRVRDGEVVGEIAGVPEVMTASPYDGLLDIKLDPDFQTTPYVYLTYTRGTATARIGVVYRARLDGDRLVDGRELFSTSPPAPTGGPNITRIQFLPDKSMVVAVGSSGNPGSGMVQRVDGDIGKIIRINRDGTIPADNALAAIAPDAKPELWATGLRSLGGFALDDDNRLWGLDIGPLGGDELNVLEPGGNYGWPLVTWGFDYSGKAMSDRQTAAGFVDPVVVWSPSIAPSGLAYYRGDAFPQWQGDLFVGSLGDQAIRRLRIHGNTLVHQERLLPDLNERIRSLATGPDGFLYAVTDSSNGKILRVRPGQPTPDELARVAQPFEMAAGADIFERLKEHGVMQSEETSLADQVAYDAARAETLFAQTCGSCHMFEEAGSGNIGPNLDGVVGRQSGTVPGYAYSAAMANSETSVVWGYFTLTAFLTNPQAYYPGNKMAAAPLRYEDALQVSMYLNHGKTF